MSKFLIKRDGRTVIKTADPAKAESYRRRPGYRVIAIPAAR